MLLFTRLTCQVDLNQLFKLSRVQELPQTVPIKIKAMVLTRILILKT